VYWKSTVTDDVVMNTAHFERLISTRTNIEWRKSVRNDLDEDREDKYENCLVEIWPFSIVWDALRAVQRTDR
jgi:hypothetical protein